MDHPGLSLAPARTGRWSRTSCAAKALPDSSVAQPELPLPPAQPGQAPMTFACATDSLSGNRSRALPNAGHPRALLAPCDARGRLVPGAPQPLREMVWWRYPGLDTAVQPVLHVLPTPLRIHIRGDAGVTGAARWPAQTARLQPHPLLCKS